MAAAALRLGAILMMMGGCCCYCVCRLYIEAARVLFVLYVEKANEARVMLERACGGQLSVGEFKM